MLKNYLKTTVRSLLNNKVYTFINLVGLTLGMALCLLIVIFVRDEFSYDQFHEKADRMYRLQYNGPNGFQLARTPPPIQPLVGDYFSEVEHAARVFGRNAGIRVKTSAGDEETFEENRVFFADSSIRDIMSFEILSGNPEEFLTLPYVAFINEEVAVRYFGDENPVGKTFYMEGQREFRVGGVFRDFPDNSHIHFNVLAPYDNMFDIEPAQRAERMRNNLAINFIISHSFTYLLLKPNADVASVNARFVEFVNEKITGRYNMGQEFVLEPVTDIHLYSQLMGQAEPSSDISVVYIFLGVAILTLLIACVNFINLSTARSMKRTREVGLRKVMGAGKGDLVLQFLGESVFLCVIAFGLAMVLVDQLLLSVLNDLTQKQMVFSEVMDMELALYFTAILVFTGVLAGSYPAFFAARFHLITALKGVASGNVRGSKRFRKGLVVFQFMVSVMLIASTLVVYRQIDFIQNKPLGFRQSEIINIPVYSQNSNNLFGSGGENVERKLSTFRDVSLNNPKVEAMSFSSGALGLGTAYRVILPEGFTREDNMFGAIYAVDYDMIDTYEIEMVAGRAFSRDFPSDLQEGYLINETAVSMYNWGSPEEAIGKSLNVEGKEGFIVGVMKDFHFTTLQRAIDALIMELQPRQYQVVSVRVSNQDIPETIAFLESKWGEVFPEKVFEYTFLDETLGNAYQAEQRLGTTVSYMAILAMIICCLGAYGLIMFNVQQKIKEIGIRKVLGASVIRLLGMLYQEFAKLIAFSFIVAFPVVYYVMDGWLSQFSYRINLGLFIFLTTAAIIFLIVFLTVSYQSLRATMANPIKALRVD